jgi:hypothetical protein
VKVFTFTVQAVVVSNGSVKPGAPDGMVLMITAVAAHVVHDEGSSITPVTVPGTSPSVFVNEKSKSNVAALAAPDTSIAGTAAIATLANFRFMTTPSTTRNIHAFQTLEGRTNKLGRHHPFG